MRRSGRTPNVEADGTTGAFPLSLGRWRNPDVHWRRTRGALHCSPGWQDITFASEERMGTALYEFLTKRPQTTSIDGVSFARFVPSGRSRNSKERSQRVKSLQKDSMVILARSARIHVYCRPRAGSQIRRKNNVPVKRWSWSDGNSEYPSRATTRMYGPPRSRKGEPSKIKEANFESTYESISRLRLKEPIADSMRADGGQCQTELRRYLPNDDGAHLFPSSGIVENVETAGESHCSRNP